MPPARSRTICKNVRSLILDGRLDRGMILVTGASDSGHASKGEEIAPLTAP